MEISGPKVGGPCANGYEGLLCSKCSAGYFLFKASCNECPNSSQDWQRPLWRLLALFLAMSVAAVCLVDESNDDQSDTRGSRELAGIDISMLINTKVVFSMGVEFLQMIMLILTFDVSWGYQINPAAVDIASLVVFNFRALQPECWFGVESDWTSMVQAVVISPIVLVAVLIGMSGALLMYKLATFGLTHRQKHESPEAGTGISDRKNQEQPSNCSWVYGIFFVKTDYLRPISIQKRLIDKMFLMNSIDRSLVKWVRNIALGSCILLRGIRGVFAAMFVITAYLVIFLSMGPSGPVTLAQFGRPLPPKEDTTSKAGTGSPLRVDTTIARAFSHSMSRRAKRKHQRKAGPYRTEAANAVEVSTSIGLFGLLLSIAVWQSNPDQVIYDTSFVVAWLIVSAVALLLIVCGIAERCWTEDPEDESTRVIAETFRKVLGGWRPHVNVVPRQDQKPKMVTALSGSKLESGDEPHLSEKGGQPIVQHSVKTTRRVSVE
ncbi:hypothetical protein HK102_005054 [Quaeritorhiza haematococci]|nr:hypothetical protein HK102_005054 [Quaeritorhiza haematococci]